MNTLSHSDSSVKSIILSLILAGLGGMVATWSLTYETLTKNQERRETEAYNRGSTETLKWAAQMILQKRFYVLPPNPLPASVQFKNCIFLDDPERPGGPYLQFGSSAEGTIEVTHCSFFYGNTFDYKLIRVADADEATVTVWDNK